MAEPIRRNFSKTGNRQTGSSSILSELGKVPPQAVEVENIVLGSLMLERNAINEVIEILESECFYKDEHKEIYSAILRLFEKSQPIDIITVTNELRQSGKLEFVGGAFYISELTNRVGSTANLEYHARIINQKFILRKLIEVSSKIQTDAFEETTDVFDLLDDAEKALYSIAERHMKSSSQEISGLINKAITQMEISSQKTEGLSGVPSGFLKLDEITSGWQPSDLIILAARPGMGKTSLVLGMARNAAVDFKKPVAIFSLEMSSVQLTMKLLSSEVLMEPKKIKSGKLEQHEWTQLQVKIRDLSQAKIFIDDTASLNIFELRAKCRRLKQKEGIELVIIDYLQLMGGSNDSKNTNREQEISHISRSLKGLAKELNVPVIALSQLSRDVEKRSATKRPQLSDLRESGAIEQDADQVMFIYRPEYYKVTEDEHGNSTIGVAEVIMAKNRHGAAGTAILRWVDHYAKFANWDEDEDTTPMATSQGSTFVIPSKMNHEDNDDEVPF